MRKESPEDFEFPIGDLRSSSRHFRHNALVTGFPEHKGPKDPPPASHALRAVVRFATTEEAHRAVRTRNNTYLGNNQVRLRVLP